MIGIKCLSVLLYISACVCMETIYMKKSILDDQESSESGYSYQVHSGNPAVFTAYDTENVGFQHTPHFGYPPVTVGKFVINDEPHVLPLKHYYPELHNLGLVDSYGHPVSHEVYALPYSNSHIVQDENLPIVQAGNYGLGADNSQYEVENGKSYKSDHSSAQGEKGDSGYKNFDGYEKGSKGKHEKEGFKEYYNQGGGNKAGHYDVARNYGNKQESGKENKGESFKQAKGHKKGSKTTGFHNVYHKDEYKKDHSFYDEADGSGHFSKYGNAKGVKSAKEGSFNEGGRHSSGHKESKHGKEGFSDKGKHEQESEGYKGISGKEAYHKGYSQFKSKHGNENDKEYGYADREKLNNY